VIALLYADTPVYCDDPNGRAVITPALLQGPVQISYWSGGRHELALAVNATA